jgi:phosphoglycolate phosphatase-like HAD superfamily hydrolase
VLGLELHDDGSVTRCRAAVIIAKHEGEVFASEVDDLGAQMAAARELLDRVYGRPRQSVEVAGVEDGLIALDVIGFDLSVLSDNELQVLQQLCERSDGEER